MSNINTLQKWIFSKFKSSQLFFSQKNIYVDPQNKKARKFKNSKVFVILTLGYIAYQMFGYYEDKYNGTKIIQFRKQIREINDGINNGGSK